MLFSVDWLTKLQYEHLVGQNGMPTYRHISRLSRLFITLFVMSAVSRQSTARGSVTS